MTFFFFEVKTRTLPIKSLIWVVKKLFKMQKNYMRILGPSLIINEA